MTIGFQTVSSSSTAETAVDTVFGLYAAGLSMMASAVELSAGLAGAQAEVVCDAVERAKARREAKSWYRHPDAVPLPAVFTGWPFATQAPNTMAMLPSVFDPFGFVRAGGVGGLPDPFGVGLMTATMPMVRFWSNPWLGFGWQQPRAQPCAEAADIMFSPFGHYRSAGGHATAQVFIEPMVRQSVSASLTAMQLGAAFPFAWPRYASWS